MIENKQKSMKHTHWLVLFTLSVNLTLSLSLYYPTAFRDRYIAAV